MINKLHLVRSIGQFDCVNSGAALDLRKLTLVYAENARGKTTLASIMRSLATGEPIPITERRRLGATSEPEAIIECSGGSSPACFQSGAWSRTCPEILIFDDVFVDRNVYSGRDVAAEQRQNLHDLILGDTGVSLARRVDDLATRIRVHNTDIREKASAIPVSDRYGLSVDEFCALGECEDVDDQIQSAEQQLAALQNADAIREMPLFAALALPELDVEGTTVLLEKTIDDLDTQAAEAVRAHFADTGDGAEAWIGAGMRLVPDMRGLSAEANCPFCDLPLSSSSVFKHYRSYFGEAYRQLQADLASAESRIASAHGEEARVGFERQIRTAEARMRFWASFAAVPQVNYITPQLSTAWSQARDALLDAVGAKRADALTSAVLGTTAQEKIDAYRAVQEGVVTCSNTLLQANEGVQRVKDGVETGDIASAQADLNRLRGIKARHSSTNDQLCSEYVNEKKAKEEAESSKQRAQDELDAYRATTVPNWEVAVNGCLERLGAGFTVSRLRPQPTGGRPSCEYRLVINGHEVAVGPGAADPGSPTFKNTLSAGDRNALALACFVASIELDGNRANRVAVFDDPMSSLDEHRRTNTVHELRRLLPTVAQVIVMSHDKHFLFDIYRRIASRGAGTSADWSAIHVRRASVGSTIEQWDIGSEKMSRHDQRHALLATYANGDGGDMVKVAQSIRPHLEHFLRAAYPVEFKSGETLREFRNRARSAKKNKNPIISDAKFTELDQIVDYCNDFHHDTDPSTITDSELSPFVQRTLQFVTV